MGGNSMKAGLEVHIYPETESKLHCECRAEVEGEPNENICPICTGQPGSKPMGINKKALEKAVQLCLVLKCELEKKITVNRKHYFYPDLPNNYQRTSTPVGTKGKLLGIGIKEMHIEEDAGKYDLKKGLVDYNRAGIPLIEMVTEPEIKSPEGARKFLKELKSVLKYLEIGGKENRIKVDTNVSIGKNRVEIKNLNSIKNVEDALEEEVVRQKALLEEGSQVKMETRHFDEERGTTVKLREKETVADYRFIPDPDVPPVGLNREFIQEVKKGMPPDPFQLRKDFSKEFGFGEEEVKALTCEQGIAELFRELSPSIDPHYLQKWIKNVLLGELNYRGILFSESGLRKKDVKKLLEKTLSGEVTEHKSREILRQVLDRKTEVEDIFQVEKPSEKEVEEAIDSVLSENRKAVEKYKAGKKEVFNFLLGETDKKLKFRIPVKELAKRIKKELKGRREK